MILFIIILVIFILGYVGVKNVQAKYILSKKVQIPLTTSDYYFNVTMDKEEINSFPDTINVTVNNHDGTNFTSEDLQYQISVNEGYTISVADGKIERQLEGNKKNEETFVVTINKENSTKEDVILTFNVEKPYKETLAKNIKTTSIKVANNPDISKFNKENTYYVTWNTTNSPYAINEETKISETPPSNWYNYIAGQNRWANIKTTGGGNDCYWVWIPRYAYKVPARSNTAQTIEVKFLQGKTNIPIGETEEITNTTPTPGTWVVHPAFTNTGNRGFGELTGMWMAKYEASSSKVSESTVSTDINGYGGGNVTNLQVRIKPNVTSWSYITTSNIFTVCRNITASGNSLVGTTNIDSHMMKNTEWGAAAYLSRSIYGKNSPIWNNPYYNGTTYYSSITGLSGATQDASQTTMTNIYRYDTIEGINASASGNVYGIYDMAGGAWDRVAAYVNNSNVTSSGYNTNLINANKKYKDVYVQGSTDTPKNNYNANTGKYGDAIYETSTSYLDFNSWDEDYSKFPYSNHPIFGGRGGRANASNNAGVFGFHTTTGEPCGDQSFRPVLVVQ